MKPITFLLFTLFLVSCSATKHVAENQKTENLVLQTEKPIEVAQPVSPPPPVEESNIVNATEVKYKTPPPPPPTIAPEINSDEIHSAWNSLLQQQVSKNGNVNYKGFKANRARLATYIKTLQTNYEDINNFSREEILAYWINAYNALTVDLILRNYPLNSIKDIDKPWDQRLWKFGNKWQNLNAIEHKILRTMNEPRIHFAIVCASESCPKLENFAFVPSKLESQLTTVTKGFLSDKSKNDLSENCIKLSKIFKWYAKDFKTKGSLIDFLNGYTDVKISSKAKKIFKDYSWALNE